MPPLTVFLTTWNTGLEGSKAQEQDLSSWLLPVLHTSSSDPELPKGVIPDIYAIAVQELLPLPAALAGLSQTILVALTNRIQSLLSAHATSLSPGRTSETYTLVQRKCHVGVALWVFARDYTLAGRIGKSQASSIGLWYLGMGNKAAVGVRVPIRRGEKEGAWETLTFVSTHFEAHNKNLLKRNANYQDILSRLQFTTSDPLTPPVQIHETSHLFFMGDLNYRLARLPDIGYPSPSSVTKDDVVLEKERAVMVELDTLRREQRVGRVFGGLREGDLTRFAPTYKRVVGQVDGYSRKRIPGYTDRILFASYNDTTSTSTSTSSESETSSTQTTINHFSSTESLTISDHKPVHLILTLPTPTHTTLSPHLAPTLPEASPPHPQRPDASSRSVVLFWDVLGWSVDRAVGWPWFLAVTLGSDRKGMGLSAFLALLWGIWWSGYWSG